jgi:hypothetical protein
MHLFTALIPLISRVYIIPTLFGFFQTYFEELILYVEVNEVPGINYFSKILQFFYSYNTCFYNVVACL